MSALQQMLAAASIKHYATWNPSDKGANVTLSNGDLTATIGTSVAGTVRATIGKSTGKWYWEVESTGSTTNSRVNGAADSASVVSGYLGSVVNQWGWIGSTGGVFSNSAVITTLSAYGNTSTLGFALDMDAGTLTGYVDNVLAGVLVSGLSGTIYPATGSGAASGVKVGTANFGATALTYSPPAGFNAGMYL